MNRVALASALAKLDVRQIQEPGVNEVFVGISHTELTDEEHHALWQARHADEDDVIGVALNDAEEGETVQVKLTNIPGWIDSENPGEGPRF